MKENIDLAQKYWQKLSKREQYIVIITCAVVFFILWNFLFFERFKEKKVILEMDLLKIEKSISDVNSNIQIFKNKMYVDPNLDNKRLLAEYLKDNKALNQRLSNAAVKIVTVQGMVKILKDVLKNQKDLHFISLVNRQAVAEFTEGESENQFNDLGIVFYRHGIQLKIEGDIGNIFTYLKVLEMMPWRVFWEHIDIEVTKYPHALVTLELFTLGFGEGVLGG